MTIRSNLRWLTAIGFGGLILFALMAFTTLRRIEVNGPLYEQITLSRDVVANYVPPSESLLQAALICNMMDDTSDPALLRSYRDMFQAARESFERQHAIYVRIMPEGPLKDMMMRTAYVTAEQYLQLAQQEYIPRILRNDHEEARAILLTGMNPLYARHVVAVDQIVELANQEARDGEVLAARKVRWYTGVMVGGGLAILIAGITLSFAISRAIARQNQELVRSEQSRREQAELLDSVIESLAEGVVSADREGHFQVWNTSAAKLLGPDPGALRKEDWAGYYNLYLPEQDALCPTEALPLVRAIRGEECAMELVVKRPRGEESLWLEINARPVRDDAGNLLSGVAVFQDTSKRKATEKALRESEARYRRIVDTANEGIVVLDAESRFTFVNERIASMLGCPREEFIGRPVTDFLLEADLPDHDARIEKRRQGISESYERRFRRTDGTVIWALASGTPIFDEEGRFQGTVSMFIDISQRKAEEETLWKTHRALRVLSQCNSAVVHATDEPALLREVCRVAVGPAGYVAAWVGYAENDEARTVRPIAFAGPVENVLRQIHVSWADSEHGRGMMGSAIRQGKVAVVRSTRQQSMPAAWHEIMSSLGVESVMAVPLHLGEKVIGALGIYARESDAFDAAEVQLLSELGENLEHGIAALRARRERAEAVDALMRAQSELEERVRQRTAELLVAKEAAESADRFKSAFLATMSHELRTPLNSIIGFTGIVLQGLPGPLNAEQRTQLGMVRGSSRHLLALINDVLDLSKIEAGQLEVRMNSVDARQAVEKVLLSVLPQAKAKGLKLCSEIAPEVGTILGDGRRIEQILLNLLSNAIKFTEQGEVEVRCAMEDGWLVISVRDSGIGIRAEDVDRLFRPFQQLEAGLARKHEGTGLGLSICKKLTELMGGTMSVASQPGQGSTFTFRLPEGGKT